MRHGVTAKIKKIYKKDIGNLFLETQFWNHDFLAITKHRLLAHLHNPNLENDDIVLILGYLNNELVGYMGVFIDTIIIKNENQKIGWLSTWWVHPKTKGSGIGREILNVMYAENNGKIGISQFTASAKRVYDKSGYFVDLKQNIGVKAVLKTNFSTIILELKPQLSVLKPILKMADFAINSVVSIKQYFNKKALNQNLKSVKIEYLNAIDAETSQFINSNNNNHLTKKSDAFFNWLKQYQWVQEAPLLAFTEKNKYEFSMVDNSFNIYLMKIKLENQIIGFLVLQKRNQIMKVLFAYFDSNKHSHYITDVIKLQAITQNIHEIIAYDAFICNNFKKSNVFLYNRKKVKNSIISQAFNQNNFEKIIMNYGDGDCCFA